MSSQLKLFRGAAPRPSTRLLSNSALAHEHIEATGAADDQRETVAWILAGHPGRTASELAEDAAREGYSLDRYQFGRRLPELASEGRAHRGISRACRVTGRRAYTWWADSRWLTEPVSE